jgi:hypothetical protein
MSKVFDTAIAIDQCPQEAKAVLIQAYEKAVELGGGEETPLLQAVRATADLCCSEGIGADPYATGVANGALLTLTTLLDLGVIEPIKMLELRSV